MADRPGQVRLVLAALDPALLGAWDEEFAAWPNDVMTFPGSVERVFGDVDAVISPGNSYGQMDGGVDRVISDAFAGVQRSVWASVADRHHGYQPVGTAAVVPTGANDCRWLIYAPTMRVPMALDAGRDVAVHDAFWAALLAIEAHNHANSARDAISTVVCPGFGTGFGRVSAPRSASLMATAYRFWRAEPTAPISGREDALLDT